MDPDLEAWLRELWARRGMPFPELNLKQAWLIPSAVVAAKPERHRARLVRAAARRPGGRRAARAAARDAADVVDRGDPAAARRSVWARPVAARTYRLAGIGESQVAELLGETMLRATNPLVATYARVEAVDVRISAVADGDRSADDLVEAARDGRARPPRQLCLGDRRDDLERRHRGAARRSSAGRCRSSRSGPAVRSGRCSATLPGSASTNRSRPRRLPRRRMDRRHGTPETGPTPDEEPADDLLRYARRARELGGSEVGLAVRARPRTRRHGGVDRHRDAGRRPARRSGRSS